MIDGKLQIRLLGIPEIIRGGKPITSFAYRKTVALLAYLAVNGKSYSREMLADLLWGEAIAANARGGLRKSLAELRERIGPNILITHHQVAMNPEVPYWLDVALVDQAAQAFKANQRASMSPSKVAAISEAIALYRGDFMAGFHVLRAPAFEEWILLERERMRLSVLRMNHALSIHYLTQANYKKAITYAEQVLALELCHEDANRLLMSLLALSGQQTAALRHYDSYCRILAADLGLDPHEETTALYERIRGGVSDDRTKERLLPQLERPSIPLIGRRNELANIVARLRERRCRLLTLCGPGGSGKTRLAREIAATVFTGTGDDGDPPASCYLISLGSSTSMESLTSAIAYGSGFYFAQESHPRRQLLGFLRRHHALLILDACEGLLNLHQPGMGSFADLVNDILDIAPGITILATSRTRLNLPCETLYPLAGMAYPELTPDDPSVLRDYDAVQLFLWRMQRIQMDWEPNSVDLAAIGEICRLARGMPLEILLMANWARLLDPPAIAAQLSSEVMQDFASTGGRISSPAIVPTTPTSSLKHNLQRSLAPVFEQSWKLMSEKERRILATLTVFRGGFTYQAAHVVSSISLSGLMTLLDQSIVNRMDMASSARPDDTHPARFEIHDLLREFVEEKQETAAVLVEANEQHSAYYSAELGNWATALQGSREQECLQTVDIEIANVRAAWEWAAKHGRVKLLDEGMAGLCFFYQKRYRNTEGESACRMALQSISLSTRRGQLLKAKALAWQGWFTIDQQRALSLLDNSLRLLEKLAAKCEDVRSEKALAQFLKGSRVLYTDQKLSKRLLEESLSLFRELEDEWWIANVLARLHILAWEEGTHEERMQLSAECLALYRKLGYLSGYAEVLGGSGINALQAGLYEEGVQFILESIDVYRDLGDRAGLIKGFYFYGMALAFGGQWEEAERQLKKSIAIGEEYSFFIETPLIALAIVKTQQGQYAEAQDHASTGLEWAREIDKQMVIGRALTALAFAVLAEGKAEEAEHLARQAVTIYKSFEQKMELGMALAAEGYAACQLGNVEKAKALFYEAVRVSVAQKDQASLLYALAGIAVLLTHIGQEMQAIEYYSLAAQYPWVANSQWFDDIVKTRIDYAAAMMPPEIAAAAVRRGQTRGLEATLVSLTVAR